MDKIQIRILHNQNECESFMRGYEEGDPLVVVFEDDERFLPHREFAEVSLDYIYAENQWINETRRPWYDDARSLSKGDVIVLGDAAYAIESIGFKKLDVDPVELVA